MLQAFIGTIKCLGEHSLPGGQWKMGRHCLVNSMKEKDLKIEKLVRIYAESATAYGLFLGIDSKKTNKHVDRIRKCYQELKVCESLESLLPLLEEQAESVRLWAAGHLLFVYPVKAEQILRELEKKSDLLGFDAMMTLREWKKGTLNFD